MNDTLVPLVLHKGWLDGRVVYSCAESDLNYQKNFSVILQFPYSFYLEKFTMNRHCFSSIYVPTSPIQYSVKRYTMPVRPKITKAQTVNAEPYSKQRTALKQIPHNLPFSSTSFLFKVTYLVLVLGTSL